METEEIRTSFPKLAVSEPISDLVSEAFDDEVEDLARLCETEDMDEWRRILSSKNLNAWFEITPFGFLYLSRYILILLNICSATARDCDVISAYLVSFRTVPPSCKLQYFDHHHITVLFEILKKLPEDDPEDVYSGNEFFGSLDDKFLHDTWSRQRADRQISRQR